MKKVYVVVDIMDYGLYDVDNAKAYETEEDALAAASEFGYGIVVAMDVIPAVK